jgi:hypothetical protein
MDTTENRTQNYKKNWCEDYKGMSNMKERENGGGDAGVRRGRVWTIFLLNATQAFCFANIDSTSDTPHPRSLRLTNNHGSQGLQVILR